MSVNFEEFTTEELGRVAKSRQAKIEELESESKNLRKEIKEISEIVSKRVKEVLTYRIKPIENENYDPFLKKLNAITIIVDIQNREAINSLREDYKRKFGISLASNIRTSEYPKYSVSYFWLDGAIYHTGGGNIVLKKEGGDTFCREIPCTKEEWDEILSGTIPYRLLSDYYRKHFYPERHKEECEALV
jgi:hypothetical protein